MNNTINAAFTTAKPAGRVLLIEFDDVGNPCCKDGQHTSLIQLACTALIKFSETLSVINVDSRLPLFGITVVGSYHEVIIPMQPIGDRPAWSMKDAVERVSKMSSDSEFWGGKRQVATIAAIRSCLGQFQSIRNQQKSIKSKQYPLSIVILTTRPIKMVCIDASSAMMEYSVMDQGDVSISIHRFPCTSDHDNNCDVMTVPSWIRTRTHRTSSAIVILDVFKSWLQYQALTELLTIFIGEDEGFCIKCDLKETIINPLLINEPSHFAIQFEARKASGTVRTYNGCVRLKLDHWIKSSGVSQAFVFGQPMIVTATRSCLMSTEELRRNRLRMGALWTFLSTNNVSALCTRHIATELRRKCVETSPATASYLLMCGQVNCSFLLLSLAAASMTVGQADHDDEDDDDDNWTTALDAGRLMADDEMVTLDHFHRTVRYINVVDQYIPDG